MSRSGRDSKQGGALKILDSRPMTMTEGPG